MATAGPPRQRFHDPYLGATALLVAEGANPKPIIEILGRSQISLSSNADAPLSPALELDATRALDAMLAVAEMGVV